MKESWNRRIKAAALLSVLAISGHLGARQTEPVKAVSVPIVFQTMKEGEMPRTDTIEKLDSLRKESLAMLEEVLNDPKASAAAAEKALKENMEIAASMDTEARLEAALAMLGILDVKAVSAKEAMMVFSMPDTASDVKTRMQIVDTAATVTGLSAQNIKIILAKNE